MSDVDVRYPSFFVDWVYDRPAGRYVSQTMFRTWLRAGLICEAEEGYAATTKGREAALAIAVKIRDEFQKRIDADRKRRSASAPANLDSEDVKR